MSDPFIGEIYIFPYNFAPNNFLPCEGQLLAIAQYQELYSIIGTTYGGDGRTTFALPDLRGRVPVGQGNGPDLTARYVGQKFGTETETLTTDELPSHTHAFFASNNAATQTVPENAVPAKPASQAVYAAPTATAAMNDLATSPTGGSHPHTNMSPYMPLQFCICIIGMYPVRN